MQASSDPAESSVASNRFTRRRVLLRGSLAATAGAGLAPYVAPKLRFAGSLGAAYASSAVGAGGGGTQPGGGELTYAPTPVVVGSVLNLADGYDFYRFPVRTYAPSLSAGDPVYAAIGRDPSIPSANIGRFTINGQGAIAVPASTLDGYGFGAQYIFFRSAPTGGGAGFQYFVYDVPQPVPAGAAVLRLPTWSQWTINLADAAGYYAFPIMTYVPALTPGERISVTLTNNATMQKTPIGSYVLYTDGSLYLPSSAFSGVPPADYSIVFSPQSGSGTVVGIQIYDVPAQVPAGSTTYPVIPGADVSRASTYDYYSVAVRQYQPGLVPGTSVAVSVRCNTTGVRVELGSYTIDMSGNVNIPTARFTSLDPGPTTLSFFSTSYAMGMGITLQ